MNSKRIGKRTAALQTPPSVLSFANIGGRMEGQGPLAKYFDELCDDSFFGEKTWEKAEATMQRRVLRRALEQAGLKPGDVDYVLAGDLLNQCIGSSFGLRELGIPFFGLYGACSTMGEALSLGAMCVNAGYADRVLALVSSHYATAEKQFRFPLGYGNQRAQSATWTVTGCGAVVLESGSEMKREGACSEKNSETAMKQAETGGNGMGRKNHRFRVAVTGITTGKLVDMGTKDSMNMGAAMAPAAFHTVMQNLKDLEITKEQLEYGKRLMELLKQPLSEPLSLHAQVITLCAATHKLFLDVPVKELKKFQKDMLAYLDQKHPQIGEEIEELHSLSDTLINKIIDAVKEYKSQVVK